MTFLVQDLVKKLIFFGKIS